jgi:purine nucleoside permease
MTSTIRTDERATIKPGKTARQPAPARLRTILTHAGKYIFAALLTVHAVAQSIATPKPIEIKVVVISMFEIGADTGDVPGEYQYWVERQHLTQVLPFPQGYHDLRLNPQTGVLGLLTGMGTARATASVMALGLDPRFDLSRAYWLVAGIAGIDPHVGSLGSAVWAEYLVDGDLGHEIDAREIPPTWPTGHVPLRKSVPYEQPRTDENGLAYHLNPTLAAWAFHLTRDTPLPDTPEIAARRMSYLPDDPASPAHRPPFVLRGDILSASNFWHGKLMSEWAHDWVAYQTDGKGHYAACGMEDTGTLESLTRLAHAQKIDLNRVMVLRTASNYDQQRAGITAAESLAETKITKYGAFLPSLDTAYRVGHVVVDNLVLNWPQTRDHIPQ